MNYLLYPVYVDSKIQFPPKSLNYAALLSISLDDKELTSFQVCQRLQKVFVHYVRLESLNLSCGYIRHSSLTSMKSFVVSRLRLADLRFDSLECLGQLLYQLSEPRKGLRNLWLEHVTIDPQHEPLQTKQKTIALTHLSCNSAVPEIFKLLHSKLYWLELSMNSHLLQSFYASPAQIASHRYPFFFNPEVTRGFSLTPTIHILLDDVSNLRQLYTVPSYIVHMYFCLLLISKSLGGSKLVNLSRRKARWFFSRIIKCFEEDQIRLDRMDDSSASSTDNGSFDRKRMVYSPSLTLSLLSFTLIMRKLIAYLEQSGTPSAETHQITIELDALKERDIVILLPNFNSLLKFLRITPSAKDSNLYQRRYSKKRLNAMQAGLIKLTFILPPTTRAIVLSYNRKKMGPVSVIETPLVLCLSYDTLTKSRFFEDIFDEVRENHDCMMLHEHLLELYTAIRRTYFDSTMSSFSSTSANLIPQLDKSEGSVSNTPSDKETCDTASSTDSDTPFTNYRKLLCMRDCQICSAARAAAKNTNDPDGFIQSIFATKNSPFYCDKVATRSIRKLMNIQARATPEFNPSATDITFTHVSIPKTLTNPPEIADKTIDSDQQSSTESNSVSFIQTDSSSEEEGDSCLSPHRSIDRLVRRAMGASESCSGECVCYGCAQLPGLFENHRLFRYLEEYVDNSNTFLVYNGCILSISYETLRKVYLLDLKKAMLHKHPILHKLSPPNGVAAITSYVTYKDVHSVCQHTIQTMVQAYLTGGYYARSMDKLLIKGTADMDAAISKHPSTEPFPKAAKDKSKNGKRTPSQQLIPSINTNIDWEAPLTMSLDDPSLSKKSKFVRCVHNLLRSHTSPMANSQLRAVAPVIYSKEYRRFYIHPAPGVIPNTLQLYGIRLLAELHKDELGECTRGTTSMCIISLHLSAYDLICILQGGLLSYISPAIRKINIETITIIYSTKLEILLLFYLLIGQPALNIVINKLSLKYVPTYRQDHINTMFNDILSSSLEWEPQISSEDSTKTNKRKSSSPQASSPVTTCKVSDRVVRRFTGNHRSDGSESNREECSNHTKTAISNTELDESCTLECDTYTNDSDSNAGSSLKDFIVGSDEETDAPTGAGPLSQERSYTESPEPTKDTPVIVGFSRKTQEFTSKKLDLVIYKDLIDEITDKTGILVNTLQYTDITLKIIKNLSSMKLQIRVRLCVLTSLINDNEELETASAQTAAEQEYATHVIFLTKILKCMIKADINAFVFENVALDWSSKLSNIKNDLVGRITGLRNSLARGVGVFYIIDSTIQAEQP